MMSRLLCSDSWLDATRGASRVERFRTCNFWPWEVRNFQPCSSSGENPGETHQNTPLTLLLTKDYRNRHSRSDHPGSRPDPTLSAKSPLPAAARYFLLQPHVSFVREFFASRALRARTPGKSGPLVNRSGKSELGGEQIGRKLCLCADWYLSGSYTYACVCGYLYTIALYGRSRSELGRSVGGGPTDRPSFAGRL